MKRVLSVFLVLMLVSVGWNAGANSTPTSPLLRVSFNWADNIGSGDWTNVTSWGSDSTAYPDDSSYDAEIDVATTVTFDFSSTLTIGTSEKPCPAWP